MHIASTLAVSNSMDGYSRATSCAASRNTPQVARSTLALCTAVTLRRPLRTAYSKAARTIRSDPLRVTLRTEIAASARDPLHRRLAVEGLRHPRKLHADIHALGVLPEHHQVDVVAIVQRVSRGTPCTAAGRRTDPATAASARSGCDTRSPCPASRAPVPASATLAGLDVMAPKKAQSVFPSSSSVRAGRASPSVRQNSHPMSP